jgi:5-methylcytosine-specific restriction endonuclease McrA
MAAGENTSARELRLAKQRAWYHANKDLAKARERALAYYHANREAQKARMLAWYYANHERELAKDRKPIKKRYRDSHREELREKNRRYYAANKKARREAQRLYFQSEDGKAARRATQHKYYATLTTEQIAELNHRRLARKRAAPGKFKAADIKIIRKLQNDRCALPHCRVALGGRGHVDHIVALSNGGTNWPKNLQLLCPTCNMSKGAKEQAALLRCEGFLL